ncbi:alpha beta hydrolase [Diplodia corticola]|uniref:Alpha beta hydrolase n=1 Tax=Diplodia corticola TaxID=236234 RepID=A0A1J9S8R7_9PEZI|nr:alpha beta hydrolase [Diplodia corticola]OJD36308.1 alpha beta hydrolase [Diplodia corticola]
MRDLSPTTRRGARDRTMDPKASRSGSKLPRLLWRGFVLSYGLLVGLVWVLSAVRDGLLFQRRSRRVSDKELAGARDRLWDLSKAPIPSFTHAFFTTVDENPVTLHYVASAWDAGPRPNLVVFLHGFPDSWALWRDYLSQKRNVDRDTVYVALDLPGFGGSDSLPEYSAYNVLEAVAGFVLGMREKYGVDGSGEEGGAVGGALDERGQVVLVSHDWGGAVAGRLASEAPQLADHFVIMSIVLPRLWMANAQAHISSARRMCHTWLQQPLNFRPLRNSWRTLRPLLTQLSKSHYIFAFVLPDILAKVLGSFTGTWFLKKVHRVAMPKAAINGSDSNYRREAAEALASSLGPSISQCKTNINQQHLPALPEKQAVNDISTPMTYPPSVHARAASSSHAWFQKTRYYRDGLILGDWSKSLQTILLLSVLDSSNSTLVGSSTGNSPTSSKFASFSSPPPSSDQHGDDSGLSARHRRRRSSIAGGGLYGTYGPATTTNNNNNNNHPSAGVVGGDQQQQRRRSSLSVGASLFDSAGSGPRGALRAPATVVAGGDDVAFDWRLALEGVGDHLGIKGGAVVVCEGAGHWLVRERVGMEVVRRVVGSVTGAEVEVGVDEEEEGDEKEGRGGSVVVVDGKGGGGGGGGGGGVRQLLKGVEGVKVTVER